MAHYNLIHFSKQCIWQCSINDLLIVRISRRIKNIVQPIKIFTIVNIGYLGLVNIERRNGYTAGNIIPIAHYIFFSLTHGEGTTLYKHKTGAMPCSFALDTW